MKNLSGNWQENTGSPNSVYGFGKVWFIGRGNLVENGKIPAGDPSSVCFVDVVFFLTFLLIHIGGFMESFFDVKIWRLAVKPPTCFAQKHTFNIDLKYIKAWVFC
jgi:hypothetical protein